METPASHLGRGGGSGSGEGLVPAASGKPPKIPEQVEGLLKDFTGGEHTQNMMRTEQVGM